MFIATQPADLRRSFDGLAAMVEGFQPGGSMSGDLFAFFNKRRTQVRMLFWDGSGYWLVMKRLEAGTFRNVFREDAGAPIELDNAELAMLLEGVDADKIMRRKRFRKGAKSLA
jgi:transposase